MDIRTQIAPKGLEFKPDSFVARDKYSSILTAISYPKFVTPGFLSSLTSMPGVKMVIKHLPLPFDVITKMINKEMGVTVIVITHEMKVIDMICDRVAVIDNSHIAEVNSVKEIFSNPQSEIARELIIPKDYVPAEISGKNRIRIVFDGEASDKPVISRLVLNCKTEVNIIFADTKDIDGTAYGQMVLELPDDSISQEKIFNWLNENNIKYSREG